MLRFCLIFLLSLLGNVVNSCEAGSTPIVWDKGNHELHHPNKLIDFGSPNGFSLFYVSNNQLFLEGWNELGKPNFWRMIMHLSADSCVLNVAHTRQVVEIMSVKDWEKKTNQQKDDYRDSVRNVYNLEKEAGIYMTVGKSDFYRYEGILPLISEGVSVFEQENVDPWYAQAILMIESPGRLAKSNVGAYGAFQLMPSVARSMGMTVNNQVDERTDFEKSAVGASKLIQNVCVPEAKKILTTRNIDFEENELWFRLFVLHIYHAGAYNVGQVVQTIAPQQGGMELIQQMWQTKSARFGNASQNYSQIALAAMMILEDMVWDCYAI